MIEQLKRMAVLAAVVQHRSFGAAARALGTSTSAVSQQIRALERDMGVTLLHRSTRSLQLTPAGERFHEGCAAMVEAARNAQAQLLHLRDAPEGELRIAATVGFARHVGPALAPLLAANPGLSLHMEVEDRHTDLLDARIDLAIRFGRLPDSGWVAQRLGQQQVAVYGAPAYLARRGAPTRPEDLATHDWLGIADSTQAPRPLSFLDASGRAAPVKLALRASSNNQLTVQQLCEAGLGLATLGSSDVAEARAAGRLIPLLSDWQLPELPIYALTPQRDTQPAKVRHSVEALRTYLAGVA
nr:LysR family transcriptional regulator [uncultured Roseateles sp.]